MWWLSIVGTAATFGQQHLTTYADIDLVALFLNKSIRLRGHLRQIWYHCIKRLSMVYR